MSTVNHDHVMAARGAVQGKSFLWDPDANSGAGGWVAATVANASGAVSIAAGSDATEGNTTDAAIVTDANGTVSGKLRGLVKMIADVWDSTNHRLNVAFSNTSIGATQSGTWSVGHGKTIKTVTGTVNTAADNTVVAAVSSKRIKVIAYALWSASATSNTLTFKDNTAGTAVWTGVLQAPAASSIHAANLSIAAPSFLFASLAGDPLVLNLSAAVICTYSITYFDDDAT